MIFYHNQGWEFLAKILRLDGSVFTKSLFVALPCTGLSILLKFAVESGDSPLRESVDSLGELSGWNGFNVLVGFLVIFRTSQAYNRFWEGCQASYMMGAEWFSACSALISFCQYSECEAEKKVSFQNLILRLFSMLHSAALGEIEEIIQPCGVQRIQDIVAFRFELLDVQGVDEQSLLNLREEKSKVELIYQWVQNVILHNMNLGVLSIPPPILTRAFAELEAGLVSCHEAFKISSIPFPFPYAQTCDALLSVHWFLVPWVSCASTDSLIWAGVFTFVQVFILWSLDFIAVEIENPFGRDPNDLDTREMQQQMNRRLCVLMRPYARTTPVLKSNAISYHNWEDVRLQEQGKLKRASFYDAWGQAKASSEGLPSTRMGTDKSFSNSVEGSNEREDRVHWSSRSFPSDQVNNRLSLPKGQHGISKQKSRGSAGTSNSSAAPGDGRPSVQSRLSWSNISPTASSNVKRGNGSTRSAVSQESHNSMHSHESRPSRNLSSFGASLDFAVWAQNTDREGLDVFWEEPVDYPEPLSEGTSRCNTPQQWTSNVSSRAHREGSLRLEAATYGRATAEVAI